MEQLRTTNHRTLTTKKVWKVAIYLRLSQEDGKDESQSITNQRKLVFDYLNNNFTGLFEVIDTYIDDGNSAMNAIHRPEFLRMISDVEKGRVDTVICKSLSRAFRNTGDQSEYLRVFFPQHQTRFISLDTPHMDTFLEPEKAFAMDVGFYGTFNESYPLMISAEIKKTMKMMREKGEFSSSFAPYGYVKGNTEENRHQFFIDEEAAEIVRKIFHWYVYDGMTMLGIVRKLNALGILCPTDHKKKLGLKYESRHKQLSGRWGISTVARILKNESYLGHMVQGKQRIVSPILKKSMEVPREQWIIVKNTHMPIIEQSLFDKAITQQEKRHRPQKNTHKIDLFSGFLKCADCNMRMHYRRHDKNTVAGKKVYKYYACSTYTMQSKEACTNHNIKYEVLQEAVLLAIQNQIKIVEDLKQILDTAKRKKIIAKQTNSSQKRLAKRQKELLEAERISESLYIDWKTEVLTKEEYIRMKSSFEEKISHLKQIVESIQKEIEKQQQADDIIVPYLDTFLEYKNAKELTRTMLIDLVEKIYIHEDKNITIEFKSADIYERIVSKC